MDTRRLLFSFTLLVVSVTGALAQPEPKGSIGQKGMEVLGFAGGFDGMEMQNSFVVSVNTMSDSKRNMLNQMADRYRLGTTRGFVSDLSTAAFAGTMGAMVNVIGTSVMNVLQVRSKQKKAWQEMRQKECVFVDSLLSVKGQSDFYDKPSTYGFLDPSDMKFDGIAFYANRGGKEVLRLVCHIDTTRLEHMFLHSKFYLVADTIVFHPYNSYLPNLSANHIYPPRKGKDSQDEVDYWNTISHFSFNEQQNPCINIRIDLSSSWINEIAQVQQNVPLGSFSVNIPVKQEDLNSDSVYFYSRQAAIEEHKPTIEMAGDCFVVPRSFMPVDANHPSWGTGEYKMKVVMTESCRYDPEHGRSSNWHHDYKQLVRMRNNGKACNEYWQNMVTTFRDNSNTILKATLTPIIQDAVSLMTPSTSGGMGGIQSGQAKGAMQNVQGQGSMQGVQQSGNPMPNGGFSPNGMQ